MLGLKSNEILGK